MEENEIINDNSACAEILNNCFSDVMKELNIDRTLHVTSPVVAHSPVETYIKMFKNHPSITANDFGFKPTSDDNIHEIIKNIDSSKAYQKNNIPPIMENADICVMIIRSDLNLCIEKGIFPSNLKNADITPIFKKLDRLLKSNYRPVSILPTLSKIYEKLLYQQMYEHFDSIFSKYLSGFRKGHSMQHCLLFMLALDNGLCTGILLTDLSKAFDCISHEFLIAKLNAYGFTKNALRLINDYLSKRRQRTKVGESFSTWRELIYGGP